MSVNTTTYYAYDKSHRLTAQYALGGEAHYFSYNERNQITQIKDFNGAGDTNRYFAYNGVGERVMVTDGGGPTYWAYDRRKLLTEKNTSGATVRRYRHNFSKQQRMTGSLLELQDGAKNFNFAFDHNATIKNMLSGEIASGTYLFDATSRRIYASLSGYSDGEHLQQMTADGWQRLSTSEEFCVGVYGSLLLTINTMLAVAQAITLAQVQIGGAQAALQASDLPHTQERVVSCGGGDPWDIDDEEDEDEDEDEDDDEDDWSCRLEIVCRPLETGNFLKVFGNVARHCFIVYTEVAPDGFDDFSVVYTGGPTFDPLWSSLKGSVSFGYWGNRPKLQVIATTGADLLPPISRDTDILGLGNQTDTKTYNSRIGLGHWADSYVFSQTCSACDGNTKAKLDFEMASINHDQMEYYIDGPNSNTAAGLLWRHGCGDPLRGEDFENVLALWFNDFSHTPSPHKNFHYPILPK